MLHQKIFCRLFLLSLIFATAISLTACGGGRQEPSTDAPEAAEPVYDVRGQVVSFNEENGTLSVVHEEIPGVMRAMRMNLRLEDVSEADAVNPGDLIAFKLIRRGASWFIRDIEVLPSDTPLELPSEWM
jgi:Cu/Ag efflux protein CusF